MGWQILEKRIGFLRHAPVLARRTTTFLILTLGPCGAQGADPFASNNGSVPNPAEYNGPLFALSHDYPDRLLQQPAAFPWQQAINNEKVSVANASAYANALKQHVSGDITRLLTDYASWKPSDGGWYNEPWLGTIRESIHGLYVGTDGFTPDLFTGTGLSKPFTTYVLTYYDKRAANTLYKVWGRTAQDPTLNIQASQFAEGSVVVKLAFSTANADVWPVMLGAIEWPAYIKTNATTGNHTSPKV
jgi:hypothetical protein